MMRDLILLTGSLTTFVLAVTLITIWTITKIEMWLLDSSCDAVLKEKAR